MGSVGAYLRELRTRRGVSLEEIARTTRVAQRYLESLEADAFDELPAPVFIRGFIRAYCQALGESPDEALTHYDSRDGRVRQPPARPAPMARAGATEPRARGAIVVSFVLLVVLGMALFTVALVIRPRERTERTTPEVRPASPEQTAPSSAPPPGRPPASPAPSPPAATAPAPTAPGPPTTPPATAPPVVRTPAPATAVSPPPVAPAPAPPAASPGTSAPVPGLEALARSVSSPYRLIARINEQTWIRVRTGDGRTSEETVPAGEIREWVSDRPFVLTIGNAGGVALELNGRALPPLGAKGVVIPRLVLPPEPR